MKILFVSHESGRNGATVSMISTIKAMKENYQCEIDVIIPGYGGAELSLKENNINYKVMKYYTNHRMIGQRSIVKEFVREAVNVISIWLLEGILREKKYDYIVSNSTAIDIAARAAKRCGGRHIYYVREFMEEDFSFEYRNKVRMKKLLEEAEKVIFISQAVAGKYLSLYKINNYKIIYNGVEASNYYIGQHKILDQSIIRLVQVGTISDGKGAMQSIQFMNEIGNQMQWHLTLVGCPESKDYFTSMKKYINRHSLENKVKILNYTYDIKSIFADADILLMNSKAEGFGRVTVEGMIAGLLVIGKNAAGTSEIITHNKTGVLFNNQEEFINNVIFIDKHREKYRKIACDGQKYALEMFRPSNTASCVMDYLEENNNECKK